MWSVSEKFHGMAHVTGDYPLYYDAINEKGLGMAGLNFVGKCQPVFPYSRFSGSAAGML
ncbi:linear amide C-N hydrolase [Fusicatenibacter sp. CLA-AA-H277]|uniref:Linear amide C-N hydrolase n=1 Tax=Fusicatenibacter faecihominis TaxID=2881276 RepID=A0AAE3DUX6_9FIRM|nr:linear amide C-N hydrolase [Fusicatenibacter faecihominis]